MIQEKVNQFLSIAAIGTGAAARMGSEAIGKKVQFVQNSAQQTAREGVILGGKDNPATAAINKQLDKKAVTDIADQSGEIAANVSTNIIGQAHQKRSIDKLWANLSKQRMRAIKQAVEDPVTGPIITEARHKAEQDALNRWRNKNG